MRECICVYCFSKFKKDGKMSYLVLRLVREWGVAQVTENTIASEEYLSAIKELIKCVSKVMKFL